MNVPPKLVRTYRRRDYGAAYEQSYEDYIELKRQARAAAHQELRRLNF